MIGYRPDRRRKNGDIDPSPFGCVRLMKLISLSHDGSFGRDMPYPASGMLNFPRILGSFLLLYLLLIFNPTLALVESEIDVT